MPKFSNVNTALSDLFFNYDHPARDELYRSRGTPTIQVRVRISEDEERAALVKDAKDFLMTLNLFLGEVFDGRYGDEGSAADLADDFLGRL